MIQGMLLTLICVVTCSHNAHTPQHVVNSSIYEVMPLYLRTHTGKLSNNTDLKSYTTSWL